MTDDERRLQFTRPRDLLVVAGVALVVAYVLVRIAYGSLPVFPRLAGISAAVLGIGEAVAGFSIRARLQVGRPGRDGTRPGGLWGEVKPLPPLVGARALLVAKASSLGGAGLTGLWAGLLLYTAPNAGAVAAAGADSITAVVGVVCALVLLGGALWLERCCLRPDTDDDRDHGDGRRPGGSGLGAA